MSPRSKQQVADELVADELVADEEAPRFTYKFRGHAPVVPMDLTRFGIGELHRNDVVELPEPVVLHDLVPQDDATEEATGALVAQMYPELVPVEADDDVEPAPAAKETPLPTKDGTNAESAPAGSGDPDAATVEDAAAKSGATEKE